MAECTFSTHNLPKQKGHCLLCALSQLLVCQTQLILLACWCWSQLFETLVHLCQTAWPSHSIRQQSSVWHILFLLIWASFLSLTHSFAILVRNVSCTECIYIAVDCCQDIFWLNTCSSERASWGGIMENCCRWHGTWDIVSCQLSTPQLAFLTLGQVYHILKHMQYFEGGVVYNRVTRLWTVTWWWQSGITPLKLIPHVVEVSWHSTYLYVFHGLGISVPVLRQ